MSSGQGFPAERPSPALERIYSVAEGAGFSTHESGGCRSPPPPHTPFLAGRGFISALITMAEARQLNFLALLARRDARRDSERASGA